MLVTPWHVSEVPGKLLALVQSFSLQILDNPTDQQAPPLWMELRDGHTFLSCRRRTEVDFLGRTFGATQRWIFVCPPRGELFIIREDGDSLMTLVEIIFVLALKRS